MDTQKELATKLSAAWKLIQGAEDLNAKLLNDIISQNIKIHALEQYNINLEKENMKLRMHVAFHNWETNLTNDLLENLNDLE